MYKIIESINSVLKPYYTPMMIGLIVIIFLFASYYAYTLYVSPKIENELHMDVANAKQRNKQASIYYFYTDWCPHCKKASPEWSKFKSKYGDNSNLVNDYKINCIGVDCGNEEDPQVKDLVSLHSVNSYPTVKLVLDKGDVIDFDSKITNDTLEQFVNTVLRND